MLPDRSRVAVPAELAASEHVDGLAPSARAGSRVRVSLGTSPWPAPCTTELMGGDGPMTDPRNPSTPNTPDAVDPTVDPAPDPLPIPGAGGPATGPTGEVLDGANQPVSLPGDRPPLSTDRA